MADDDTVITIEPDTLGDAAITKTTGAETTDVKTTAGGDAVDALKSQYDDLQKTTAADLARERTRAAAAEDAARRAQTEVAAARTEIADTHLSSVESGLEAATTARDAAKKAYKAAMESANWDDAAEAQSQLATAAAQIERLTEAKADLTVRKTQRTEERTEAPQVQSDPIEQFISGPIDDRGTRRAPNVQTWLREHQDYITDPKKLMKLDGAHRLAVSEDLVPQSDAYITRVEEILGMKKAPDPAARQRQNGQQQRRQSVPAAPVNGGGGSSAGGGNGGAVEVRLTAGQSKAAEDGTHVWGENDLKAGRIKDRAQIGEPIGLKEMGRRVYLMGKERPGIFENGNIEQ